MAFSRGRLGLAAKPRFYLYLNTGTFARSKGKVQIEKRNRNWIGLAI